MLSRWLRREDASPSTEDRDVTPADEVTQTRASLEALVRRTNRAAGRLPEGAVPTLRAIEDVLRELLDHAAATTTSSVSAQERFTLGATVEDYLPTSLDAFLALPPAFADTHRDAQGRSPGDLLLEQLGLLDTAVRELAVAVYSGDAARPESQGRFLDTKFSGSDLDLR